MAMFTLRVVAVVTHAPLSTASGQPRQPNLDSCVLLVRRDESAIDCRGRDTRIR
jgi:hypothetical protein